MEPSERALADRARRAYERGRWQAALWRATPLLPLLAWTVSWCRYPALAAACGAAVVALTVAFAWRGGTWGRAIVPGLAAGIAPLTLPLLVRSAGDVCMGGMCCSLCAVSCVAGGIVAGILVGRRAVALPEGRGAFLAAAGSLAVLAGAPGCALAGVVGLAGLLAGFAVGTAPAAVARAAA
jgi:hypothetical protein